MIDRRPPHHLKHLYHNDWYAPHQAWLESRGVAAHHPTLGAEPERLVAHNSKWNGLNLKGANLAFADLAGSSLQRCDLEGAFMNYASLRKTGIIDCNMSRMAAREAYLSAAHIYNSSLAEAILYKADMRLVSMANCLLNHADLESADLTGCRIASCSLLGARLRGAALKNMWLSNVIDDRKRLTCLTLGCYHVTIFDDQMIIGCSQKSIQEWLALSDDEIEQLAIYAGDWNKRFRPVVLELLKALGKI